MANQYIGERYVPLVMGDWDVTQNYERLSQVYYQNKGYLSRRPVPAGTLPTNTDYWALVYDNTVPVTGVSWTDILNKPTSYPPSAHTQDWSTVTGKPLTYQPAMHTHTQSEVAGLPDKLIQLDLNTNNIAGLKPQVATNTQDIADLKAGGGGGSVISATLFYRANTDPDLTPGNGAAPLYFTQQTDNRANGIYWQEDSSGYCYLKTLDGSTGTYDIFMSGVATFTTSSSSGARYVAAVRNSTRYACVECSLTSTTFGLSLPETYLGNVVANSTSNSDRFFFQTRTFTSDRIGGSRDAMCMTLKAIRR